MKPNLQTTITNHDHPEEHNYWMYNIMDTEVVQYNIDSSIINNTNTNIYSTRILTAVYQEYIQVVYKIMRMIRASSTYLGEHWSNSEGFRAESS